MAYTKTTWNNNAPPAINADNLNKIEQGIYDAHIIEMLLCGAIPDTKQTIVEEDGTIKRVLHKRENTTIRTDTLTFATGSVTEVRTLKTGENVTIVTNLATLETTITYATS